MAASFFPLATIFIDIFMLIIFYAKKPVKNEETTLFSILLVVNLIECIFDVSAVWYIMNGGKIDIFGVIQKLDIMMIIWWAALMFNYVYSISFKKYHKTINYIGLITVIISCILTLVLPITPLVTETSVDSSGLSVDIAYGTIIIFALGIIVSVIISIIKDKNNIKNKKYFPLYALIVLAIIGIILRMHMPLLAIEPFIMGYVLLIMYFTIENPDVKMIEQLEIAKESADKANNAKSEFLSNMSHEIRTPLNAIVGFSESLKDDNIPPSAMEKVNDIIMASNNLLDIVNGILDISKIEANKLEIIEKEYETEEIFKELISLTKARIGDKALDFRVSIDPSIPAVLYGDNARIKQVVLNILTNAVKYTKEGWVDFKVSSVIKDNVCRLIISVEDTGIGIKEESLPKLFSKFDRLNVEKEMTIEGTGLGLAITKKLVELMNGKIIVQSVYGQGSKFTISIDQKIVSMEKPAIKEAKVSETKIVDAQGANALIVDDNLLNIKVASTLLKKYNFNLDSANSGAECLDKIASGNQYDIIFLDDMMPKMSGREVLAKLKENADFHIPTIALTANAIDGMKEEYLGYGFDDYLSKPIEKNELERVINKYIHKNNANSMNSISAYKPTSLIDMTLNLPRINTSVMSEKISYQGKTALLVDDNEMNLKVEEMVLKKYGFEITKVSNGRDAIGKVIESKYDIIFLDDMMPELDGCKTFDNLKDLEGFATPTILLTASSYDEVKEKIEQHHFNGYLSKPLRDEQLDKILKELLN